MNKAVNILMLEDTPLDAELVHSQLTKGGLQFALTRVDEGDRFAFELKNHTPDLVFSDHGMPMFDGFSALAMVRHHCPSVPFIFVTGSLGEEMTIKAFDNGASDCVLKHRLADLVPAVKRALDRADEMKRLREAEAEVRRLTREAEALRQKVKAFDQLLPICSGCKRIRDEQKEWQPLESYLHQRLGLTFSHGVCPDCIQKYFTGYL